MSVIALVGSVTLAGCVGIATSRTIPAAFQSAASAPTAPLPSTAPPSAPELPAAYVDTSMPTQTGSILNVPAGGDFQGALSGATCGDTIQLAAGATYTGNFTLPFKSCTGWVVVRTSAPDSSLPAPGVRINPTYAGVLPKIVSPNVSPAISTQFGANHYRFIGVEVTTTISTTNTVQYGLIDLGDDPATGNGVTSLSQLASFIFFDRCYIHGTPTGNVKRGLTFNAASLAVIDSYVSDIHLVGQDSQAIGGWNGPGPFKIVDNYLEAATENVMFGGATPSIPGVIASDIEIRGNHFFKPLSWRVGDPGYGGIHWSVKNLLEFKIAQRVLVIGNVFENNWADAQVGFAILLTPRTESGAASWIEVQDITFTANIVRHTGSGLNILGIDDTDPQHLVRVRRVLIKDNLFDDVNSTTWGGDGRLFQLLSAPDAVTIDHNTAFEYDNSFIDADGAPSTNFVYRNNITPNSMYGISGSNSGAGLPSLTSFFPGYVFRNNVIENVSEGGMTPAYYPPGNFFPATWSPVMFTNQIGGDYRLCRGAGNPLSSCVGPSPYINAGSDGKDIGADIVGLDAATARTVQH